jgi:nitroreductase
LTDFSHTLLLVIFLENKRALAYASKLNDSHAQSIKDNIFRSVLMSIMSLIDNILTRRSIRRYETKDIPEEVLRQILEAGRQAPSAVNKQPIRFVIVKDRDLLKNLCDNVITRFVKTAPVAVVGCADVKSLLTGKWAVVDATIAMQNMVIAAWTLGVGSCWIGACNEEKVKEMLKIPDKWKVVALITFGYPAEQPKPRKKKPFEELFSFNSF